MRRLPHLCFLLLVTGCGGRSVGGPGRGLDASSVADGGVPGACACNPDVDGREGPFFFTDVSAVDSCIGLPSSAPCELCRGGTCATADVDCDGDVDSCDREKVLCAIDGGTDCCNTVICGACLVPDWWCPCFNLTETACGADHLVNSTYLGDGTECSTVCP